MSTPGPARQHNKIVQRMIDPRGRINMSEAPMQVWKTGLNGKTIKPVYIQSAWDILIEIGAIGP